MAVNVELLQKTLDAIKANPQHWDQSRWHCGTSHCFAGLAQLIHYGLPINTREDQLENDDRFFNHDDWNAGYTVGELLGLEEDDAQELFAGWNSLERLEALVSTLIKCGTLQEDEEVSDEDDDEDKE